MPKELFTAFMAPVSATTLAIIDAEDINIDDKIIVSWIGETSIIAPSGARWMGALSDILKLDDEIRLNIFTKELNGINNPWAKNADDVHDLEINCVKDIEEQKENLLNSDILIYSHPKFANESENKALLDLAYENNIPVYGLFWNEFDSKSVEIAAQSIQTMIHEPMFNPLQVGSDSASSDIIASTICKLSADNSEHSFSADEAAFYSHMRDLSGLEGHSAQEWEPGSIIEGMTVRILPDKFKFISLLDNYMIEVNSGTIFRKDIEGNTLNGMKQVSKQWIDRIMAKNSFHEKLLLAYKIKASYVFDLRIQNVDTAKPTIEYFIDCYKENKGINEAKILGANILINQRKLTDTTNLEKLYKNGVLEAGILLAYFINQTGLQTSIDVNEIAKDLSKNGFGEFTLELAKTNDDKKQDYIDLAATQFSREALYINAITEIETGQVAEGLDNLLASSVLGDHDASQSLPDIVEHLKKNHKHLLPIHHIRNLAKYREIQKESLAVNSKK